MAVTFTGAGVANAASGASPQAVTTATALAVGDFLVALMAYDNSQGSGADPSSSLTATPVTGALGAAASTQAGLNDPGAASAGLVTRCVAYPVTTAIPSGTVVNLTWSGTVVVRAAALMKVSSAGVTVYRTNSGASGTNGVAVTTVALTTPSVNNAEGVLCWAGHEYGEAVTGDADTTNGSWSSVYGTFTGSTTSGMGAYFQSKVVTATATQAFNPTGTSSDWIVGCLIFTESVVTQASYRIYDDGTETAAPALAAQDTAANGDIRLGDGIGQLRLRLQNTVAVATPATDDYQLQWEKNGNGTWTNVTTGSSTAATYNSTNLTDGAVTTNRLGAGTGSFAAGKISETGDVLNFGWAASNYTELLYPIAIKKPDVVVGDVIRFRLLRNGVTTGMTYTVTPTVNVIQSIIDNPATISSNWGSWSTTTTADVEHIATSSQSWGTWTGTAAGTITPAFTEWPATISTNWSGGGIEYGDTFNRSDLAAPGLGSGWSAPDWGVASNAAARQNAPAGSDYARFLTDIGATDQWVEMSIPTHPQGDFRVINSRMTAALGQNGVLGFIDIGASGVAKIGKVQGGTYADVNVGSSPTLTNPFTLRLECSGTTATLFCNGTQVATGSIAGLTLGTFAGMNANISNATMDSFRCGPMPYGAGGAGWTAAAIGDVRTPIPATITSNWGVWVAAAVATPDHPVTISTNWGTWTGTAAVAFIERYGTITSSWGSWSASAAGVPTTPAAWAIPQNVLATTTGITTITVTWDDVPAATGYDVERNGTVIVYDHPDSPYNDSGLNPDTLYSYRVRAVG